MKRPDLSECAPFYHGYLNELPAGEIDIMATLRAQGHETRQLLAGLTDEQAKFHYGPEKWSIKEMLGHLIDAERVFAYRAFCFARNDSQAIPGMDQDKYVENGSFDQRSLSNLLEEIQLVRQMSLVLFESFDESAWMRKGVASGVEFTVRTFPFIIAGHERHHQRVLREKYLKSV